MKIDPTFVLISTKNSTPLAIPLVGDNGVSIGLAFYSHRVMPEDKRYYTYKNRRFFLKIGT